MHRFYRLDAQPDLFGQWGRVGNHRPGSDQFPSILPKPLKMRFASSAKQRSDGGIKSIYETTNFAANL
jgi:predicted DNA-binding WGR domain protein